MKRDPNKMPVSGLVGWGAAETILKRMKDEEQRALLTELVRKAGLQGAPALGYLARWMRWLISDEGAPAAPEKLTLVEIAYVERRAAELLHPYVGDPRLPHLRNVEAKAAA